MKQMLMGMVATLALLVGAQPVTAADLPGALLDPYMTVQAQLAADNIDGLAATAKAIETAATPLGKDADGIVSGAQKLAVATTIVAARTAFGDLSTALVKYADASKTALGTDLHVAYCPMVNKSWVQKGTTIKNPYYGAEMLTCGVITR